jgi:hypothetical protein
LLKFNQLIHVLQVRDVARNYQFLNLLYRHKPLALANLKGLPKLKKKEVHLIV